MLNVRILPGKRWILDPTWISPNCASQSTNGKMQHIRQIECARDMFSNIYPGPDDGGKYTIAWCYSSFLELPIKDATAISRIAVPATTVAVQSPRKRDVAIGVEVDLPISAISSVLGFLLIREQRRPRRAVTTPEASVNTGYDTKGSRSQAGIGESRLKYEFRGQQPTQEVALTPSPSKRLQSSQIHEMGNRSWTPSAPKDRRL